MANSSSLHYSYFHSIISKLDKCEESDLNEERNQNYSMNIINEFQDIQDDSKQALDNTINFQNINIEEEMKDVEPKMEKDTGFQPSYENIEKEYEEVNESFFHDNKNLLEFNFKEQKENAFNNILNEINNFNINNDSINKTVIYSNSSLNDIVGFRINNNKGGVYENDISKIKKSLIYIKNFNNKSSFNSTKSNTKEIINSNNKNQSVLNDDKKLFNVIKQTEDLITNNIQLNSSSCQLSNKSIKSKRGRKQILISGIKTEILDKTFLRQFKKYLNLKKQEFKNIFEEDNIFWNEFLERKGFPFCFTQGEKKLEFKSCNKNLMNFIFSKSGANTLYNKFILETKDDKIFSKEKIKKCFDNFRILFCKYYRNNLNRLYSNQYSEYDIMVNDINIKNIKNVSNDWANNTFL